jgi:hypothetical protein
MTPSSRAVSARDRAAGRGGTHRLRYNLELFA